MALTAHSGANLIRGAAGDDIINGAGGNDTLRGDAGADTFVFEVGGDNDVIADFSDSEDMIDFSDFGFLETSQAMNSAEQVGDDVVFTFGDDTLTIEDVTLAVIEDYLIV